jgi:GTP cyclohydrolase II
MTSVSAAHRSADEAAALALGGGARDGASGNASDELVARLRALHASAAPSPLPFVTLSYAQSLDGSLTAARGAPTALSCAATLTFTHQLRAAHAALLVGVGTLLSDDPSLTVRLCAGASPVAVVVDAALRTPPGCRAVRAWRDGGARAERAPIVLHARAPALGGEEGEEEGAAWAARRAALLGAGVRLVEVPAAAGAARAHLDLRAALAALAAAPFSLASVMVEGGASVLASFCEQQGGGGPPLVAAAAVTLAPLLLPGGLHIGASGGAPGTPLRLRFERAALVGQDLVALATAAWGGGDF